MRYISFFIRESKFPLELYGDTAVFRKIEGWNAGGEILYSVSVPETRRDLVEKLQAASGNS
jgi:hypothetical protein